MDKKGLFKFLFPEYQVYDSIKREGFIKKKIEEEAEEKQRQPVNYQQRSVSQGNTQKQVQNNDVHTNNTKPQQQRINRPIQNSLSGNFNNVDLELQKAVIGDPNALGAICTAFRRPFVEDCDSTPRNTMLILGSESVGKVFSIQVLADILERHKVLDSSNVDYLDLANYKTASDDELFVSNLYEALYSGSNIVILENIEKTFPNNVGVIGELIKNGYCNLGKRYTFQLGTFTESKEELEANQKYIVFISAISEEKFAEFVGNQFMQNIHDVIQIPAFNPPQIHLIVLKFLNKFVSDCNANLDMTVTGKSGFMNDIQSQYNPKTGVEGFIDFIDKELYKPLAEYRLHHNALKPKENVVLRCEEGNFIANIEGTEVALSKMCKNYDKIGLETVKKELDAVVGLTSVKEYVM